MIRYWVYEIWEDSWHDGEKQTKQVATAFTFHFAMRLCCDCPGRFIRQQQAQGEYAKELKSRWKDV